MSKTIWKYTLAGGSNLIRMPEDAQILSVAAQGDAICLWALVTPHLPLKARAVHVVGTGQGGNCDGIFIGSLLLFGDSIVLHVFDGGFSSEGTSISLEDVIRGGRGVSLDEHGRNVLGPEVYE